MPDDDAAPSRRFAQDAPRAGSPPQSGFRRPWAATGVGWLIVGTSVPGIVLAIGYSVFALAYLPLGGIAGLLAGVLGLAIAALQFAAGLAVLRGQSWGRKAANWLLGATVAAAAYTLVRVPTPPVAHAVALAIAATSLALFNTKGLRAWFASPGPLPRPRHGDKVFRGLTTLFAAAIAATFGLMVYLLARQSSMAWNTLGFDFITSRGTFGDEGNLFHGAWPYLYGTLVTSLLALLVAVPVAVGTGIALVEILPKWVARPVGLFVELLAAVPSIIFGIWGLAVIVPFVHALRPNEVGQSLLAASLVLAIMVLPIITSVTRDMLRAVPRAQREAALALGATPWEVTWGVVLPNARSGILAAAILGLGRAIGETMAVILVIGYKPEILLDLFKGGATMASAIASDFGEAQGLHRSALIEVGLIMLLLSLVLSIAARLVVRTVARRGGAA